LVQRLYVGPGERKQRQLVIFLQGFENVHTDALGSTTHSEVGMNDRYLSH
jgi:hypothetical protein